MNVTPDARQRLRRCLRCWKLPRRRRSMHCRQCIDRGSRRFSRARDWWESRLYPDVDVPAYVDRLLAGLAEPADPDLVLPTGRMTTRFPRRRAA